MNGRPELTSLTDPRTFTEYYYLKEELVRFCRENGLPVSGAKSELTERIAYFLETGNIKSGTAPKRKHSPAVGEITDSTPIEENIVCSEKHRAYFKEKIGNGFTFNVAFQKWLKANAGKTYADAVAAYHEIIAQKKTRKTVIDGQFEYNTYIRDFFADNHGKTLDDAIKCCKYKKSLAGHNRYEHSDLAALTDC